MSTGFTYYLDTIDTGRLGQEAAKLTTLLIKDLEAMEGRQKGSIAVTINFTSDGALVAATGQIVTKMPGVKQVYTFSHTRPPEDPRQLSILKDEP